MNLFIKFKFFVQNKSLFQPEDKLLLALSGGVDSMVLLSLLKHFKFNFEVAHANFQLREEESVGDVQFIEQYCKAHSIKLHLKTFETNTYALSAGIGIQEAARKLRYNWFEDLRFTHSFDTIVTAHHANDQVETIIFHLLRGAGSKGLSGIMTNNGFIKRPLLFANKQDLLKHASENFIPFRTDSSNLKDKYSRNFIRQNIIPKMQEIQPALVQNIIHTGKIMEATSYYFQLQMDQLKKELIKVDTNQITIALEVLIQKPYSAFVLYELIKSHGFNFIQCNDMISACIKKNTGAIFHSSPFTANLNRGQLIISESIEILTPIQISEIPFQIKLFHYTYHFSESNFTGFSANTFWLDLNLIKLPFQLRSISTGDKFKPLGLNHMQKVSDYLINQKVSLTQKKCTIVLHHLEEIYALIPHQVSNDFKINDNTKRFLKIEQKKEDND